MSTEYKPRPGSTADLALQQLRIHGPMSRDALALAIDKPGDEIRALMGYAVNLGLIAVEQRPDGSWFSLGDGKPKAEAPTPAAQQQENAPKGPLTAVQTRVQAEATEACSGAGAGTPERTGPASIPQDSTQPDGANGLSGDGGGFGRRPSRSTTRAASMKSDKQLPPPGDLPIALWSDGTLQIQRDADDLVLFTRDEARQLVAYLDSIALDSVREAA
jgi:hypothetical protein